MYMDFIDQIRQFGKRVESLKDTIQTEEATKTSIIMPFFSIMGYDVFNPLEFTPEYTADVGIKKGEKVDYAIMRDGNPMILIEAKWIGEPLEKHDSQLFRYFGTTTAKFGILTNGIIYKFYTDLEEPNKMDEVPFLEINILDLKETQIPELKKFHKSVFDVEEIVNVASELKYSNEFKQFFAAELQNPSDELIKHFLNLIYKGIKTQNVIEKFRPIVKKSLNQYITEMMNDKIKNALKTESDTEDSSNSTKVPDSESEKEEPRKAHKIVTTQDELEANFIVKNLLKDTVSPHEITFKDTESYISILYKNNVRKWICRLILTPTQKILNLPGENKETIRINLESLYDLENYGDQLHQALSKYL